MLEMQRVVSRRTIFTVGKALACWIFLMESNANPSTLLNGYGSSLGNARPIVLDTHWSSMERLSKTIESDGTCVLLAVQGHLTRCQHLSHRNFVALRGGSPIYRRKIGGRFGGVAKPPSAAAPSEQPPPAPPPDPPPPPPPPAAGDTSPALPLSPPVPPQSQSITSAMDLAHSAPRPSAAAAAAEPKVVFDMDHLSLPNRRVARRAAPLALTSAASNHGLGAPRGASQ